jgi:hypothetical protein
MTEGHAVSRKRNHGHRRIANPTHNWLGVTGTVAGHEKPAIKVLLPVVHKSWICSRLDLERVASSGAGR